MFFYKFTCSSEHKTEDLKGEVDIKIDKALCDKFCEDKLNKDVCFVLIEDEENLLSFAAIYDGPMNKRDIVDELAQDFIKALNKNFDKVEKREITIDTLKTDLRLADENKLANNYKEVIKKYYIEFNDFRFFDEKIMRDTFSKEDVLQICEESALSDKVKEEVERIYMPRESSSFGVPVHYIVDMERNIGRETVDVLIKSLRSNGRMIRDKYVNVRISSARNANFETLLDIEKVVEMNEGGVVVVTCDFEIEESGRYSKDLEILKMMCDVTKFYADKTTVIFNSFATKVGQVNYIKNNLLDLSFVELQDKALHDQTAKNFLIKCAKENEIEYTQDLINMVENRKTYEPFELRQMFKTWRNEYVKTVQFPQYSIFLKQEQETEKPVCKSDAFKDLNGLIGLENVKKVVTNFINYAKLQKACELQGRKSTGVCRHMSFVGNPGTAKTTVARIVAQIMKEEGLLSNGKLIEVGRADIVSKYVGGTAPKVKELFKNAIGNVLFIDEAYSLYDGKDGMYGDEAINAIVQEMENNRENLVVIFAGYKKEMEKFLEKNSGLKSRIAYEIEFPDYSAEDLMEIANFQAKNMDVDISACVDKLKEAIAKGKESKNFGNGRFIRNTLEKARMNQATRLVNENKLNTSEIGTLLPEDIEIPTDTNHKCFMGFCD